MSRDLLIIAISMATWGVGEGMFLYFQSLYLQQWGANSVTIGSILGAVGISMAIAQLPAGIISDRVGSRPVIWASWIIGLTAAWVMALANTLNIFVFGMLLYGVTAFVMPPLNRYSASARGKWSVARALTFVSASFHLGATAGPFAGGALGELFGLKAVYQIAACFFILSTLLIFFIRREPKAEHHEEETGHDHLWKNKRFIWLLALIFPFALFITLPQPLTPNFLQNVRQLSLSQIGLIGTAGSLGNALLMFALGNMRPAKGLVIGPVLVGVFCLLIWQGNGLGWYLLGYFAYGGYRLSRSMIVAYARPLVKQSQTGLAFGLVETANGLAAILAPVLAGLIYAVEPTHIFFYSLIGIAFVLSLTVLFLRKGPDSSLPISVTSDERFIDNAA